MATPINFGGSDIPDAFVAVMGVTGSGKSTFINVASGVETVKVGHHLTSCTEEVRGYRFYQGGYNITLIDTPGFNDTERTEAEILHKLATWLERMYENKMELSGVIYLHRISDPRMEGSALRNLRVFRKLCGDDPLKNVILATTFWQHVSEERGLERMEELKTKSQFWGDMIAKGSRAVRFDGTQDCALSIVLDLIQRSPVTLDLQYELKVQNKDLPNTAAGLAVNEELEKLAAKHTEEMVKLQKEMEEALANRDKELQEVLEKERHKQKKALDQLRNQQEALRAQRRSERRKLEEEFNGKLQQIQDQYQKERLEDKELWEQNFKFYQDVERMKFDDIVARMRENENKLQEAEQRVVDMKIREVQSQASPQSKSKKMLLLKGLTATIGPVAMGLLGFPMLMGDPVGPFVELMNSFGSGGSS